MHTRRSFARSLGLGAAALTEAALAQRALFAQRAAMGGNVPADTVWLNANEFPEGPPPFVVEAMTRVIPTSNRYHYQEFREFYTSVANSEGLKIDQVLVGAGSSELLHAAVDAFTTPTRPLIAMDPTYELPAEIARASGRPTIKIPLTPQYGADVKRMVAEAAKAGGGMLYFCNPNNPTSSLTPKADLDWTVANLPPNTYALIDEAYLHFAQGPDGESALPHVKAGKNVIITRTFSKIYGMAGLRVGFGCARPDLIQKMTPFRDNVVSIIGARAVLAALAESPKFIPQRRARLGQTRTNLCSFLQKQGRKYIEPHANFMMIDVGRDVRTIIPAMLSKGVATGRPFPPLDNMLRVSIGTDEEMAKFQRVFAEVVKA